MRFQRAVAQGFTLIEMAIVLVIIGLVVSGGLITVTPIIENTKVSDTKSKLDRIEDALTLYAIRHGCLPCPATPNDASTAATAGQAIDDAVYLSGCADNACAQRDGQAVESGVVPWRNLELSEADITDGFGNRVSYVIGTGMAATLSMHRSGTSYTPLGDITVNNAAGTAIATAAAYVLVSHGPNRVYGYLAERGVRLTSDPNASVPELANSDGQPYIQNDVIAATDTTHFDDIVRWRSKPIITQLCGDGACGNP